MKCKFLEHGVVLQYEKSVKPCCVWKTDDWHHPIANTDLTKWFDLPQLEQARNKLAQGIWPKNCSKCERQESSGRGDSMRLNGKSAYGDYSNDEITLEIRPGNTCNFSCQSCWPEASSRVASHHRQAFGIGNVVSERYTDYSILDSVAHRIRDIVVLGGEPFYDKSCLKFFEWLQEKNLDAGLLVFTNASMIDFDFVESYQGKLTMHVSLDAFGRVAEYVRQGTEWDTVKRNYDRLMDTPNVDVRVNITASVYNYPFISELVEWLAQDWPGIVTFGTAFQPYLQESVVPKHLVEKIAQDLERTTKIIWQSKIPEHQQHNASNALQDIANKLLTKEFDATLHDQFVNHCTKLDEVKNLYGEDYDEYFARVKIK
tara:strand:+ start:4004 stop:5119 length:1116 start_codon:yes stop_codon:yes gene_type:complete